MATNDRIGIDSACRRMSDAIARADTVRSTLRELTTEWDKYPAWMDFMCTELDQMIEHSESLITEVNHAKGD